MKRDPYRECDLSDWSMGEVLALMTEVSRLEKLV